MKTALSLLALLCPFSSLHAWNLLSDNGINISTANGTVDITGDTVNRNPPGIVGEFVSSSTVLSPIATSGQFGNVAQITLTQGHWAVSGAVQLIANGATVTQVQAAISKNSGNTTTDHAAGDNLLDGCVPTTTANTGISIPEFRAYAGSTITIYLKVRASYTVATPQAAGRVSAKRIR